MADSQLGGERHCPEWQPEQLLQLALQLLDRLNQPGDQWGVVRDLPPWLQGATGLEAVGIRLRDGEDDPYFTCRGFPARFIQAENSRCARDAVGQVIRDAQGQVDLVCACGLVLLGQLDETLPSVTPGGSLWTNCVTETIATLDEEGRRRFRGRCITEGYESVALVPIRCGEEIVGLIHLADHRRDCLSAELVRCLEGMGVGIGVALRRKQAEEALRQSQRLRAEAEKLAAAGRVAARIAHEINNPLAGIKNSFMLVKKAVPTDHPRYEFVGLIEKEIDRIAEIVRQMYDLHRPHQDVEREIRVADAIHDVVTMLQPLCRRHQVRIETELDDSDLVVCFPESALRQLLFNLLDNAIEASPYGGQVKIDVRRVEETIVVRVADEGIGIPEELRTRIFEPFFTTKERGAASGLGLGLSICQGIIEALQGSIELQSTAGRGSAFHVKLPLHRRSCNPREGTPGDDPAGR